MELNEVFLLLQKLLILFIEFFLYVLYPLNFKKYVFQ